MAQIQPSRPRRKAVRYGVPVAVAGIAAATVGLVPAIASAGSPDLPKITAEQLVAKMARSDVQHLSGTVKTTTDLGLPSLPGAGGAAGGGGPFGGGGSAPESAPDSAGKGAERGGDAGAADPRQKLMELASGTHTLRVAADGPQKQRVSMVEEAAEYSLIRNGGDLWAYDSGSNSAYHAASPKGSSPKGAEDRHGTVAPRGPENVTPQQAAQQALKAVESVSSVSVDGTQTVAGRDAYQLVITPKGKGAADSTIGDIRVAVDGENGVPLKFTLNPKGGGKPVIDTAFTKVDFAKPEAGTFDFKPPKGTKVTESKDMPGHGMPGQDKGHGAKQSPEDFGMFDKSGKHAPGKGSGAKDGKDAKGQPDLSGLNVIGQGWGAVAELPGPKGGLGLPKDSGSGAQGGDAQAQRMLDGFTKPAKGDFGTGRVFSTRIVNALITDEGKVYVGAVSKEGLIKAADKAAAK